MMRIRRTPANGKTFDNSTDLIKYVQGLKLGLRQGHLYNRGRKKKTATGKIIKIANGKNGIGTGLTDHTEVKSPETKFKLMLVTARGYVIFGYLRSVSGQDSCLVVKLLEQALL